MLFGTLCVSVSRRLVFRFPGEQVIKINSPEGFSISKGRTYGIYDTVRFPSVPGAVADPREVTQALFQNEVNCRDLNHLQTHCVRKTHARCHRADAVPSLPGSCHNSFPRWQSGVQNPLETRQTYAGWLHVSQATILYLAGCWIN